MPQGYTFGLSTVQRIFKSVRKSEQQSTDLTAQSKKHYRMNDFVPRFHVSRIQDATKITVGEGFWLWEDESAIEFVNNPGIGDAANPYIVIIYPDPSGADPKMTLAAWDHVPGSDSADNITYTRLLATLTYASGIVTGIAQHIIQDIDCRPFPRPPTTQSALTFNPVTDRFEWLAITEDPVDCS